MAYGAAEAAGVNRQWRWLVIAYTVIGLGTLLVAEWLHRH